MSRAKKFAVWPLHSAQVENFQGRFLHCVHGMGFAVMAMAKGDGEGPHWERFA